MDRLIEQFKSLINRTETNFIRFLHAEINWEDRLIAILGGRGVGKTTLMLQQIKLHHNLNDTLYISADDFYDERIKVTWISNDLAGAFASPLKLPASGYRKDIDGSLSGVGTSAIYWTSTAATTQFHNGLSITINNATNNSQWRATGCSVRCIKD